jgi:hypothetical protein
MDLLADLGFPGLREVAQVNGDEAGSINLEGRAIGVVSGWTLVWDPVMFIPDDPVQAKEVFSESLWVPAVDRALARMSASSRIYSFVTEGTSGTHGFAWYVQGTRRRLRLCGEGVTLLEDGAPLPEELTATSDEPDEEQQLFVLMKLLTGVSVAEAYPVMFRVFA